MLQTQALLIFLSLIICFGSTLSHTCAVVEALPGTRKPEFGRLPPPAGPPADEPFGGGDEDLPAAPLPTESAGVVPALAVGVISASLALLVLRRRSPEPPSPTMMVEKSAVQATLDEAKFLTLLDWLLRVQGLTMGIFEGNALDPNY